MSIPATTINKPLNQSKAPRTFEGTGRLLEKERAIPIEQGSPFLF
jgi:hypothetical protein